MRKNRLTSAATDVEVENVAKDRFSFLKTGMVIKRKEKEKRVQKLKGHMIKMKTEKTLNF